MSIFLESEYVYLQIFFTSEQRFLPRYTSLHTYYPFVDRNKEVIPH